MINRSNSLSESPSTVMHLLCTTNKTNRAALSNECRLIVRALEISFSRNVE